MIGLNPKVYGNVNPFTVIDLPCIRTGKNILVEWLSIDFSNPEKQGLNATGENLKTRV